MKFTLSWLREELETNATATSLVGARSERREQGHAGRSQPQNRSLLSPQGKRRQGQAVPVGNPSLPPTPTPRTGPEGKGKRVRNDGM